MKKLLPQLLMLTFAAGIYSCAPTVKVSSDFDRDADFSKYKTYTLAEEVKNMQINELDRRRLIEALEAGLSAKGITASPNGDLLVNMNITAEKKQSATATSSGPGYGYGGGYAYRWGGGFSTTNINIETYVDGTLFIDFIDASKKQLVWQGRGVKTLDPDATAEQKEQRIKQAVNSILAKYPPVKK
jgi:hypothetical protein